MPALENTGGLDIDQDVAFERRRAQVGKLAWTLIALALVAAALGLFGGSGPLVATTREAPSGSVEAGFDRFARLGDSTVLDLQLSGGEGPRNVAISRDWLEHYRVGAILPEPESVTALPDRYVYTFDAGASGLARMTLTPREIGVHDAVVWGPDDERVAWSQLVYP